MVDSTSGEAVTRASSDQLLFDHWSLRIGLTGAALSCLITFVGTDSETAFDWFVVAVFLLAIAPYVVGVLLSASSEFARVWSRLAVSTYGILDVGVRAQAVWWPQGSTDGLALVMLPVTGAPATFGASAVVAAIFMIAKRRLRHRA